MNRVLLQAAIIGGYCFSKREEDYISSEPYVGLGVKHSSLRRVDGLNCSSAHIEDIAERERRVYR